jgi:hypothetical protein
VRSKRSDFIAREMSADAGEDLPADLKAVNSVCNEEVALAANAVQTSK